MVTKEETKVLEETRAMEEIKASEGIRILVGIKEETKDSEVIKDMEEIKVLEVTKDLVESEEMVEDTKMTMESMQQEVLETLMLQRQTLTDRIHTKVFLISMMALNTTILQIYSLQIKIRNLMSSNLLIVWSKTPNSQEIQWTQYILL